MEPSDYYPDELYRSPREEPDRGVPGERPQADSSKPGRARIHHHGLVEHYHVQRASPAPENGLAKPRFKPIG
jgi:hypothetical protein